MHILLSVITSTILSTHTFLISAFHFCIHCAPSYLFCSYCPLLCSLNSSPAHIAFFNALCTFAVDILLGFYTHTAHCCTLCTPFLHILPPTDPPYSSPAHTSKQVGQSRPLLMVSPLPGRGFKSQVGERVRDPGKKGEGRKVRLKFYCFFPC